jgi:hypothetical protein
MIDLLRGVLICSMLFYSEANRETDEQRNSESDLEAGCIKSTLNCHIRIPVYLP